MFGPNCAWISAIIKVLIEIYNEPDLKLNLKFEIEILCKELNVDINAVENKNYLKPLNRTVNNFFLNILNYLVIFAFFTTNKYDFGLRDDFISKCFFGCTGKFTQLSLHGNKSSTSSKSLL